MKVVAIGGSPRLKGSSNYLIDLVLKELNSRGVETEKFVLNQYKIGPCQAHDNCGSLNACLQKDDAPAILEKFTEADGVILASPVYMFGISAQMKTFMDRNFFFYTHKRALKAKVAGLIAIGGGRGADEAIAEMKKLIGFSRAKVLTLTGYTGQAGEAKNQPRLIKQAKDMGKGIAEALAAKQESLPGR